jgi:hypothetical protein
LMVTALAMSEPLMSGIRVLANQARICRAT